MTLGGVGRSVPTSPGKNIWIFGFGSLVHNPGFKYSARVNGYIKGYRRVFWQGSTDHRGTPEAPGRVATLHQDASAVTWGVAYQLAGDEAAQRETLRYMEWREKEYDQRVLVDVFGSLDASEPTVVGALTYLASHDVASNAQYLGPASVEAIAAQIAEAVGPSGPNYVYLFRLAHALREIGGEDPDLIELERAVGALLEARGLAPGDFMGSCPGNHALFWSGREGGPAALAATEVVHAAKKS